MEERVQIFKFTYGDKVLVDISPKRKNWERFMVVLDITLICLLGYQIYNS